MTRSEPGHQKAARHEYRALNYRRQAELMIERDADLDSAGILLYESAKQCINAVANQYGENPGPTGTKVRFLRDIAGWGSATPDLLQYWQAADSLHIYADQGHLTDAEFMEAWARTQTFIDRMLQIYAGG